MTTIFLVDDDPGVLKALSRVLRTEGWSVESFTSADAFLKRPPLVEGCLVVDVTMPGLNGLALQQRLNESGQSLPIIFVSGTGDIPTSVRAIKAGATDFLTKPVQAKTLVDAVRTALDQDVSVLLSRTELSALKRRLDLLTSREREVLHAIATGRLNKQIADDLGIVEQTVKFHRAHIMERMNAKTVAELMHMTARLGLAGRVGAFQHSADADTC